MAVGQWLSERALLLLLFQMRIVRARATPTTGSKVRRGSARAQNPFPALAVEAPPFLCTYSSKVPS